MVFKGIIDTTFREGQQSPLLFDSGKYRFNIEDKKTLIHALINLGIRYFEFFSPVVSIIERDEFAELKKYMHKVISKKAILIAHCRCHSEDIKKAIELGFNGLNLYMAVSKKAQTFNYKKNLEEIVNHITQTIIETRQKYPSVYLRFSIEDAFRTSLKNIFLVYDRIYQHIDTLGIPDTVGIATPEMVKKRVRALKKRYPDLNLECHFHNDRGFALVNTITAIENGVEFADCSVWGLGERSGIASTSALLFNLFHIDPTYTKNYRLELCYPLNVIMGSILKSQVPYNEPVSLANRTHIAGVHQKAVINNKVLYEGTSLEPFGVTKNQLLLGPLSGWNLIYYYLKEIKNYNITEQQAKEITNTFKNRIDKIEESLNPEELLEEIIKQYPALKYQKGKYYDSHKSGRR